MSERFIVVTEDGEVLVTVNPENAGGFDPDLLLLGPVTPEARAEAAFETPLRAFAAKIVDLIHAAGPGEVAVPPRMHELMVREKATSELRRIERWARNNPGQG